MYNICNIVYKLNTSLRDTPVVFSQNSHHLLCEEKPSSTNVLLLSHLHQSLIASSKTVASPCRARTLSTELDFGVALTPITIVILPSHRRSLGVRSMAHFAQFPEHILDWCLTAIALSCSLLATLWPPATAITVNLPYVAQGAGKNNIQKNILKIS